MSGDDHRSWDDRKKSFSELDKQRREFNFEERQKIGLELQHYLLVNSLLLHFLNL